MPGILAPNFPAEWFGKIKTDLYGAFLFCPPNCVYTDGGLTMLVRGPLVDVPPRPWLCRSSFCAQMRHLVTPTFKNLYKMNKNKLLHSARDWASFAILPCVNWDDHANYAQMVPTFMKLRSDSTNFDAQSCQLLPDSANFDADPPHRSMLVMKSRDRYS